MQASRQVVFYADVANSVPGIVTKNTPQVRPRLVLMFEDGAWVIKKLHWSSWGGAVARATGISSASTGVPSNATAPRVDRRAGLVVSHRERLFGREVYGCFQLTVPSYPASDQHECLQRNGNQYAYGPVPGSPLHLSGFLSPDRKIWCRLDGAEAFCGFGGPPSAQPGVQYAAQLRPEGQLATCSWQPGQDPRRACLQNWDTSATVLKAGQLDDLNQYRCRAAAAAITCTVDTGAGKGYGFTIAGTGVTRIP